MESSFIILTESSCDLTPRVLEHTAIEVLPLTFTIDGQTYPHYPDERAMSLETFYTKLRGGAFASTAAANVAELSGAMERHLREGRDVLFLCFSSGLSSTCGACEIAAAELRERYPERKILTVDTLSASCGQGMLCLMAEDMRRKGESIERTREFVEQTKGHLAHRFTVDDLTYLRRGGRLSAGAAAVGTMLQIKPVLRVNEEGRLVITDKVRGRKTSIQTLLRYMEQTALEPIEHVMIAHADALTDAEFLRGRVMEKYHLPDVPILPMGPVIGAHTGPGLLGLFFLANSR